MTVARSVRAGRAALIGVALLLGMLLAGLWLVPGLLDWNRYRDSIAALATSGVGRPVRITGGITLHLLPQPLLTAAGIAVDDAGDGVVLTAQELRLRVALGPLLAGNVDARDLVLRGADLRLPWPPAPGALSQRPPTWLTGLQARVENSRIQVGGLAVTAIDALVATDPDTGTLSAAGTGQVGARPWRFTARLTRPGRDNAAGLDISLDGQGPLRDTGGTFSGQLAGDGALSGRVTGRGADLSRLLPAPAVPWRGDGRLGAAGGLAVADELALEIDGSPARGAVALRVLPEARLDLALAAGRLDLDAWLPVLMRGADTAMPTGIDLSAEAATLAGGTLRRLRGAFDLDPEGVTVRDASAVLPGDAQLTLSGRLAGRARAEGTATRTAPFEGAGRIVAPDLRATLRWLEPLAPAGLPTLPSGVLRTADLSARVSAGGGQASLSDLRGVLDGGRLTGGLGLKLGPRLSVGVGLSLDRLTLDPWVPDLSPLLTPAGMVEALGRAAGIDAEVTLEAKSATWRGLPMGPILLDAQSEATRLTLRRLEAGPMGMRLLASGTVGEGGRVSEGRVELSAPDLAPVLAHMRAILPADLGPAQALLRGPGTALLQASGPPEALSARLTVEASDVRLEAQPVLNLAARRWVGPVTLRHPGAPRLLELAGVPGTAAWLGDGSLSLLAQVTAQLTTQTTAKATNGGSRITLDSFDLVAGSLRARGQLSIDGSLGESNGPRLSVAGQVAAETLPLPLPYPRSPGPIPFAGLLGWQAALRLDAARVLLGQTPMLQGVSADMLLRDGVLSIPRATGQMDGGTLSGTLTLAAGKEPPVLAAQARLSGAVLGGPALDTAIDVTGGIVDGQVDLTASGYSPAALLATLSGSMAVVVRDGVVAGVDLPTAAAALTEADRGRLAVRVARALTAGATPFTRLDWPLQVRRGVLSGDGVLTSPAGEARLSGSVDLLGGAADLRATIRPAMAPEGSGPGPELGLRITGPAATLSRTPELAGLSLWLAERP